MAERETNAKSSEIPTRTAQHCAQCTAHGQIALLKGHKKICPFKDCTCMHCVLVNNKRQIMAKQVKLKRLQEKNHGLRKGRKPRVSTKSSRSKVKQTGEDIPISQAQNKLEYLDDEASEDLTDIPQYQEEVWKAVCGSELIESRPRCSSFDQWSPVSPLRFSHINPLQLQPASTLFQPRSPSITMTTSYLTDSEILSLNHIQTQPVYYTPPGFAVSLAQANQLTPFSADSFLPLEMVPRLGSAHPQTTNPHPMDAAQTLLTLRTGEE